MIRIIIIPPTSRRSLIFFVCFDRNCSRRSIATERKEKIIIKEQNARFILLKK
jgi:hypothetical protein